MFLFVSIYVVMYDGLESDLLVLSMQVHLKSEDGILTRK